MKSEMKKIKIEVEKILQEKEQSKRDGQAITSTIIVMEDAMERNKATIKRQLGELHKDIKEQKKQIDLENQEMEKYQQILEEQIQTLNNQQKQQQIKKSITTKHSADSIHYIRNPKQ